MALVWRKTRKQLPYALVDSGDSFVLARWGGTLFMGVYLSPRLRVAEVEEGLDAMTRSV